MSSPSGDVSVSAEQCARGGVVAVMRGGVQRRVPVASTRAHLPTRRHQRFEDACATF